MAERTLVKYEPYDCLAQAQGLAVAWAGVWTS